MIYELVSGRRYGDIMHSEWRWGLVYGELAFPGVPLAADYNNRNSFQQFSTLSETMPGAQKSMWLW